MVRPQRWRRLGGAPGIGALGLLALVILARPQVVEAGDPEPEGVRAGAYDEAVRLVGSLYLRPEQVEAGRLLREAARGLADDVDWLLVEAEGNTVFLRHGDGRALGSLSVANLETLPEALAALEDLVRASGLDTGGIDLRLSILQGMTRALDRYSTVLSGDRLDRFDVRLKGTLVGVGLTVSLRDESMVITSVVEGGPADSGGVKAGDVLVRIDGVSTLNMPVREASRRIRGEAGSPIVLTVRRADRELALTLERREIVVPNVEHRVLDGGVGYVRITHFSQRTDENLRDALVALGEADGLGRGLIIDLRRNTGGSMKDSARSADEFVHEGLLLRTVGPDGGTVRNLQSRMDAASSGTEPDVPVVVLTDRRTASGSEIMAGALLQLGRAALVGSRSYGKGTVQKVYPIDPSARLKLTVARYLLAGGTGITEDGLDPDLALADVILDDRGMRFHRFTEPETGKPFDDVVPVVFETEGWRGRSTVTPDVRLEVGRRAVLRAQGPSRQALLIALDEVAHEVRAEQEAHLVDALGAHGIDWNRLGERVVDRPVDAEVRVVGSRVEGDESALEVRATVSNREDAPLERVVVVLSSESFPIWDGIAMPIGRIGAGETATGVHTVRLVPGVLPREDDVLATLRVAGRPPLDAESVVLRSQSAPLPELALTARLVPVDQGARVDLTVHNLSDVALEGIEAAFAHPGDLDVEVLTQAARLRRLAPRGSARVTLELEPGPQAPAVLPLHLTVDADGYRGALVDWPLDLPLDGTVVALQAPRIQAPRRPLSVSPGPLDLAIEVTDETRLDHVVVYANGEKVAWAPGGSSEAALSVPVQVVAGENVIAVLATDEHGVRTREVFRVRGEDGAAMVDAADGDGE